MFCERANNNSGSIKDITFLTANLSFLYLLVLYNMDLRSLKWHTHVLLEEIVEGNLNNTKKFELRLQPLLLNKEKIY
jgi:hypothetical protein